jgi:glycosyltransferase involved in cell wall biosynthesis
MFIVLANATLANYFQGGGHWAWFLQYPLGLKQLGHRVFWLEVMPSTHNAKADSQAVRNFFGRLAEFGLERDAAVVVTPNPPIRELAQAKVYGRTANELDGIARDADLLWNFWYALDEPFLHRFRRRAFIDVDPGHLQVCVALGACTLGEHHAYLTIGLNVGEERCQIPTLGLKWRTFRPFVHLPSWNAAADPGPQAPFTSVTHWKWEELHYQNRVLGLSKRKAYLRYLALPRITRRRFELAVNIGHDDQAGDQELLLRNGWSVVDPYDVAPTPAAYRQFIQNSRAEFVCPKLIHLQLNTGWLSDRSIAYLASGRPVVAEDTGFSAKLAVGQGLLAFTSLDEAAAAVAEVDANYQRHSLAARELAQTCFDSRRCLSEMLSACGL